MVKLEDIKKYENFNLYIVYSMHKSKFIYYVLCSLPENIPCNVPMFNKIWIFRRWKLMLCTNSKR